MVKTVALDIGNVCRETKLDRLLEKMDIKKTDLIIDEILSVYIDLEVGKINEDQWLKSMYSLLDKKYSREYIREVFVSLLDEEVIGMSHFVKEMVSLDYRVIFFSNISELHLNEIFRKLSFANLVTGGIFSFEVGSRKPEPLIYELFEQRYGKPCFYIDDLEENCEAAKKLGWNVHKFEKTELCRKAFLNEINFNKF